MPLGEYLMTNTRDKILWSEFIDIFFQELEKKNKEDLENQEKEHLKCHRVDHSMANWYQGFLTYAGIILQFQLWWAQAMLQYVDIICKNYTLFSGSA